MPDDTSHVEYRPRRRWRRKVLLALIVLLGAAWLWLFITSRSELNRAIAETDALDPGWRLADIEAARAKVPDAENSAVVIEAGCKLLAAGPKDPFSKLWNEEFGDHAEWRLTPQQIANLAPALVATGPALVEFRKVRDLPRGRWPLTFGPNVTAVLPTATMTNTRKAAEALRYDLYDRLEANDVPAAADRLLAQINVSRSIGDEPFVISTLVRVAIDLMALHGFERFLAQTEPDEITLARLQHELENNELQPIFYWGLRGERGWGFEYFEYYKSNPSVARTAAISPKSWMNYLFYIPGAVNHHQAALLQHMNRLLEAVRNPPEAWAAQLESLEDARKALPALAMSAGNSMARMAQASQRHSAYLRSIITAIAAERYRIKFGKWPNRLDDLVGAKYLSKIPIDPFNGQPLVWKATPEGWVIYSVGVDRVDNGGVNLRDPTKPDLDVGYRLIDPAKRRQVPPPPKPAPATDDTVNPAP